jgi:hypothetical protein
MGIGELFSKASLFVKSHLVAAACVCGAVFIVLALLVVLAFVKHIPAKKDMPPERDAPLLPVSLSPEDFFMPSEPDFVPRVLLEREPKDGWGEEDARPFWTDPMEENAGTWRDRIKKGVDGLLENVP